MSASIREALGKLVRDEIVRDEIAAKGPPKQIHWDQQSEETRETCCRVGERLFLAGVTAERAAIVRELIDAFNGTPTTHRIWKVIERVEAGEHDPGCGLGGAS